MQGRIPGLESPSQGSKKGEKRKRKKRNKTPVNARGVNVNQIIANVCSGPWVVRAALEAPIMSYTRFFITPISRPSRFSVGP